MNCESLPLRAVSYTHLAELQTIKELGFNLLRKHAQLIAVVIPALRLDPLSLKALDDLRGQVLNDMKGEELSEACLLYTSIAKQ